MDGAVIGDGAAGNHRAQIKCQLARDDHRAGLIGDRRMIQRVAGAADLEHAVVDEADDVQHTTAGKVDLAVVGNGSASNYGIRKQQLASAVDSGETAICDARALVDGQHVTGKDLDDIFVFDG